MMQIKLLLILNFISQVEMANLMRSNGKIYVVVAVISIIFLGIIFFLIRIDSKIRKIEKRNEE
ncbi:MAG: CcmD family protein [Flavobacteriales bacterium]|nr:CcmD family protein [Flavobacteriales bacterium]